MFEAKIKFDQLQENGTTKKVTEKYIVDAISVTDAETKVIEELSSLSSLGLDVVEVKKFKIQEIFMSESLSEDLAFFKAKVVFITIDEKSGKEKKQKLPFLVEACDVNQAIKFVMEQFKNGLSDYYIDTVSSTNIVGVIK